VALLGAVRPRGMPTLTTDGLQYECWGVKLILRTRMEGGKRVEKEAAHRERRWGQRQKEKEKKNECGDGQVERRVKSLGEGTARGTINVNTIGEWMRVKNRNHMRNR
jgi:hypothetical protein